MISVRLATGFMGKVGFKNGTLHALERWRHCNGGPALARHDGEVQHRRGGDADQARDCGSMQQGSRRSQRADA